MPLTLSLDAASAFGASVGSWPPFPDSSLALAKLKDLGLSLVVLSNVDNASFAQYVRSIYHPGPAPGFEKSKVLGPSP